MSDPATISINAVTLATRDMREAVRFYCALGLALDYGGEDAGFTSFRIGEQHLNLVARPEHDPVQWWGRVIFYVSDVDTMYEQVCAHGISVLTTPRDAEWGERYFHLRDPDGHELSFATVLPRREQRRNRGQSEASVSRDPHGLPIERSGARGG